MMMIYVLQPIKLVKLVNQQIISRFFRFFLSDIILGVMPFVEELLRRGTKVRS